MGGQGPPYPVRPQSLRPASAPGGRPSRVASSASEVADGGRLYRIQCTQVVFGASGSGASGSSTISARLLVPAGTLDQASGGDRSSPSQVYRLGIAPPGANASLLMDSFMAYRPSSRLNLPSAALHRGTSRGRRASAHRVRLDAKRAIRKRLGAPRASSGARSEGIGEAEVARLLYCDAATLPNDGRHCRLEGGWSAGNFALRAHPQVYPVRAQGSATGAAL